MISACDTATNVLLGIEGDYSDHPSDSGGKTRWGITEAKAREHGYEGDMRKLPLSLARSIYQSDYWDLMKLDRVHKMSPAIAYEMFDTGVNSGPGRAVMFLQRGLTALNRRQKDYKDIAVDGGMGFNTLAALDKFLLLRGEDGAVALLELLNNQQGAFLLGLVELREKDEDFFFGWLKQRVVPRWKQFSIISR